MFASIQPCFVSATHYLQIASPWVAAGALLLALIAFFYITSLSRRISRLTLGRGGSIEESISILNRDIKELQTFRIELEKYLKLAELRMRGSVQGIGIIRFNPFSAGSGGNQSFSIAFLDERHSGVVFSTLYTRDRVGVYAKPLEAGTSTFELTKEEMDAIEKAKTSIVQNKRAA